MAAVKLQRAGRGAHAADRQNSNALSGSTAAASAANAAAGVDRQASVGSAVAAAAATALTPQQQQAARDLMRNQSTMSTPDPTIAEAAARLLEVQQPVHSKRSAVDEGTAAASEAAGGSGRGAAAGAATMRESMTFVMLVSVEGGSFAGNDSVVMTTAARYACCVIIIIIIIIIIPIQAIASAPSAPRPTGTERGGSTAPECLHALRTSQDLTRKAAVHGDTIRHLPELLLMPAVLWQAVRRVLCLPCCWMQPYQQMALLVAAVVPAEAA
ncbi:hypothetical protein COO60DRAFT_1114656 [Scenedesmus sp. NREL 46B-D3]|nr:hypothetical protein COO60DRAFT_1114656 [Scenedesmus sp. NREL 46B-D3]